VRMDMDGEAVHFTVREFNCLIFIALPGYP